MNKITDVLIKPLNSSVCKPFTMHYTQNGVKKSWDLLIVEDSVVVIVYNISRKVLLFQKLFKPAVYYGNVPEEERKDRIDTEKYPADLGITYQFCSKPVKSDKENLVQAACETVEHAFGYTVPTASVEKVASYRSGVGTTGSKQFAYYCQVTDEMKSHPGNANDAVEIVEMSVDEVKKYVQQKSIKSPQNVLFGIYWFLYSKT